MELRLSLHEVISKSTQALRALNFPPALDTENGKNIGWLESRGLPGLQMLAEEIKAASDTSNRSPIEINIMKDTVQFSSQGYSAFNFAQSAVDFAENGKIVSVKKCRFPLLIFAEMARREHLDFGFEIQWMEDNKIIRGMSGGGKSEICFYSESFGIANDLKITAVKSPMFKDPLKLLWSKNCSNESGVNFKADHWDAICATAQKVLVPDSKQSHCSAGAEVDDNN